MKRVVILQEYIPEYRQKFFESLIDLCLEDDIELRVGYGLPTSRQAARGDATNVSAGFILRQREVRIWGSRVVIRLIPRSALLADLMILEQARRNVDAYRLFLPRFLRRPRRIALWGHGRDYVQGSSGFRNRLQRALTTRADWFFGYTDESVEAVSDAGFPRARATIVKNSNDTTSFVRELGDIAEIERADFKEVHDLHGATALYVGGLDDSKRIPFLLEAGSEVHQRLPEFRLLIAGSGEHAERVMSLAQNAPWVRILGTVSGHQKALAFDAAEVIAMPGRVGLVAVDSIVSGTPIVTTDFPWHAPEFAYVADPNSSFVSRNSIPDYRDTLLAVLQDTERLHRVRARLIARRGEFGTEQMALNFYTGIKAALEADQ